MGEKVCYVFIKRASLKRRFCKCFYAGKRFCNVLVKSSVLQEYFFKFHCSIKVACLVIMDILTKVFRLLKKGRN